MFKMDLTIESIGISIDEYIKCLRHVEIESGESNKTSDDD